MARKKRPDAGQDAPNLVQIMTVSLFIIILAFFILLNSIAVVDEKKKRIALNSLVETFNIMAGGNSFLEGAGESLDLSSLPEENAPIDFSDLFDENGHLIQHLRAAAVQRGTAIQIPADLLFDRYGTEIKPSGYDYLDRIWQTIQKSGVPVEISGHTDGMPMPSQTGISNRELSALRAVKVLRYFAAKGEIAAGRLTAYGWGEFRPIATNRTPETRAFNRRIDIVFVHQKQQPEKPKGFTFKDFFFRF